LPLQIYHIALRIFRIRCVEENLQTPLLFCAFFMLLLLTENRDIFIIFLYNPGRV